MPYRDKRQQQEFQRKHVAAKRAAWVRKFGGCCKRCGSTEKLQFDHIDATKKVSHRIWSWTDQRISEELLKCQLLCRTCHQAKTNEEMGHGKHGAAGYKRGCRCGVCVVAQRKRIYAWRERVGGRKAIAGSVPAHSSVS